jgi:inorganic pyrophosphatase
MADEKGPDAKVLAVPFDDPRWERLEDLDDAPVFLLAEISHFFEVYKALEPAKSTDVGRWAGRDDAWREIADSFARHG